MTRLTTLREWLVFTRNGTIVGFVAALLFFWGSPHSADGIAIAIALPLILFNCIPIVLLTIGALISALLPPPPQNSLQFGPQPVDIESLPFKQRMKTYFIVWTVLATFLCFFAAVALLVSSFIYPSLGLSWVSAPARKLSLLLFAVSLLPIVGTLSFVAGMNYTGKLRDSAVAMWIYLKTIHPVRHWPTIA